MSKSDAKNPAAVALGRAGGLAPHAVRGAAALPRREQLAGAARAREALAAKRKAAKRRAR